jgi:Sulfotransferase family
LLNFFPDGGHRLVKNEQAAYEYWLRRVNCCVQAEQAYGPSVVYRLRYSDLIERSESAMRSLLTFLGEPYASQCLEPLAKRVNTSKVPADFNERDPATDPIVLERARKLGDELQTLPQPSQPSLAAAEEIEAAFNERVNHVATMGTAPRKPGG